MMAPAPRTVAMNIRGLDPEVARAFKAQAAMAGLTLSEYFTEIVKERT